MIWSTDEVKRSIAYLIVYIAFLGSKLCYSFQISLRTPVLKAGVPVCLNSQVTFDYLLESRYLEWKSVAIGSLNYSIDVLEAIHVDPFLDDAIKHDRPEPYGVVTWNSSHLAAALLAENAQYLQNKVICDLGCGTGLSALVACSLGATVIALDNNDISLELLRRSYRHNIDHSCNRKWGSLMTRKFDMFDENLPLPPADLIVMSDVMYFADLAAACAERAAEAYRRGSDVLVTDPGRPTSKKFIKSLEEKLALEDSTSLSFKHMSSTTTSGTWLWLRHHQIQP